MISLWVLRISLIAATYFGMTFLSFVLLNGFFWDAGSAAELSARSFPTRQDWLNLITNGIGIVSATLVALETRPTTKIDSEGRDT